MANKAALNTTAYPTLTQVLINTREGLFDFKAQQASGSVDLASKSAPVKTKLLAKAPTTGAQPWLKEV